MNREHKDTLLDTLLVDVALTMLVCILLFFSSCGPPLPDNVEIAPSCSGTQVDKAVQAWHDAVTLIDGAVDYTLQDSPNHTPYEKWLGGWDWTDGADWWAGKTRATNFGHVRALKDEIHAWRYLLDCRSSCDGITSGAAGHKIVAGLPAPTSSEPLPIALCPAYFESQQGPLGYGGPAATLVHEVSHFMLNTTTMESGIGTIDPGFLATDDFAAVTQARAHNDPTSVINDAYALEGFVTEDPGHRFLVNPCAIGGRGGRGGAGGLILIAGAVMLVRRRISAMRALCGVGLLAIAAASGCAHQAPVRSAYKPVDVPMSCHLMRGAAPNTVRVGVKNDSGVELSILNGGLFNVVDAYEAASYEVVLNGTAVERKPCMTDTPCYVHPPTLDVTPALPAGAVRETVDFDLERYFQLGRHGLHWVLFRRSLEVTLPDRRLGRALLRCDPYPIDPRLFAAIPQ